MQNVVEEVDDEVSTDGEDIDDGGTFLCICIDKHHDCDGRPCFMLLIDKMNHFNPASTDELRNSGCNTRYHMLQSLVENRAVQKRRAERQCKRLV